MANLTIEYIRTICGFYHKESFIDSYPSHYCLMRHVKKSIYYPQFIPTVAGQCDKIQDCPMYKVYQLLKEN